MLELDEILHQIYHLGFNDEYENINRIELIVRAYNKGQGDAALYDDLSSVRNRPWKETLKLIHKQ